MPVKKLFVLLLFCFEKIKTNTAFPLLSVPSKRYPSTIRLFENELVTTSLDYIISREAMYSSIKRQMTVEIIDTNPILKQIDHAITFYPSEWVTFAVMLTVFYFIEKEQKTNKLENVPQFQKKRRIFERFLIVFMFIFIKNVENAI